MTKGYKTTEFWLSLIAVLVGALMASGVFDCTTGSCPDWQNGAAKLCGIVATVLGALGYNVSRTKLKAAATEAVSLIAANPNPTEPPKP